MASVGVLVALGSTTVVPPAVAQERTVVTVDLAAPGTPVNAHLAGLSWNAGEDLRTVADIAPPSVRIDGGLQDVSPAKGVLQLDRLLRRVSEIRRIGADPLVILSYMPAWLGEPVAFGRDPTRVAPADLDDWEALIVDVVRALATAPEPAYRFEVWNEPDLPTFFQDSPDRFLDMAARSHRAVATVAAETGLPLQIGGPATAAPDPVFMVPYAQRMVADGLPLDFVSWHYYANHPFFGPDGNEGFVPDLVYEANARRNPGASPRLYGEQPAIVDAFLAPVLAGSDRDPELLLTEWNISAGGFDVRHARHEGAAFVVGTLTELERGGLDRSDYYRAIGDDADHPGDWATVDASGERRPSWWALQAWNETVGGSVLPVTGDDRDRDFWVRATRAADGRIDVFLAGFSSRAETARSIDLVFDGVCSQPAAEIGRLDPTSSDLATRAPVAVAGSPPAVQVDLPSQSAAFVRLRCAAVPAAAAPATTTAPGTSASPSPVGSLPATGPRDLLAGAVVLAAIGLVLHRRDGSRPSESAPE